MSAQFYLFLHLSALIGLVAVVTANLTAAVTKKSLARISGTLGLVIFVSGFGLMARTGTQFAPWLITKLLIWLILISSIPILAKRFPEHRIKALAFALILLIIAIFSVVFKPGNLA